MNDSLPELRAGRLPMGPGRSAPRGQRTVDAKSVRLIQCLVVGVDAEIEDRIAGVIPAGVPLTLTQAARAVGMRLKRARQLQ